MTESLPQHGGDMRHDGREQQHHGVEAFLTDSVIGGGIYRHAREMIQELHDGRDCGVEFVAAADVVTDLHNGRMDVPAQRLQFRGLATGRARRCLGGVLRDHAPQRFQKTVLAFDRRVRPFERLIGWRGEHGVEAHGIGAVTIDQRLRIDAVVFRLRHLLYRPDGDRLAVGLGTRR